MNNNLLQKITNVQNKFCTALACNKIFKFIDSTPYTRISCVILLHIKSEQKVIVR